MSDTAEPHWQVLAAMDVDREENAGIRQAFNITGYPTIIYINPTPPKAPEPEKDWAEEAPDVKFLTDNNFVTSLAQQSSALVMFYAPWCGHCKAMKPAYQAAAQQLKQLGIPGLLAAVDATKYRKTAEQFNGHGISFR
uniref:Thioredoxin domain-containing protein n=1 Tax=Macrostomum lignano TaxID=282301 RepID=A0A1I8FDU9_9PLAT